MNCFFKFLIPQLLEYFNNDKEKLLEQFYTDIEFPIDKDVKIEPGLVRFCEKNNFYSNKIMD